MHAHLGLACCVESINYARFLINDQTLILDHLGSVPYPFAYNEAEIFSDENIVNLATLKRIALPDSLDADEEKDQIAWDLSNCLIEPLDNFVYYKTFNSFKNDNFTDYLTIAIRKNIINAIKKLSELVDLNLIDISVNQLNTEIVLQNLLKEKTQGLIAIFKIAKSRLESTFLWNGNYYTSHYDRLLSETVTDSADTDLSTKIKSKIKQTENLFEQMIQQQIKIEQIYLYGNLIEDKFVNSIQKNMSVKVSRLDPLQNIDKSEILKNSLPASEESTKYVESVGVVLDQ